MDFSFVGMKLEDAQRMMAACTGRHPVIIQVTRPPKGEHSPGVLRVVAQREEEDRIVLVCAHQMEV